MKVKLSDIAHKTGYSLSTVSRVLTQKGYVNKETRAAIEQAMDELGYLENRTRRKRFSSMNDTVLILTAQMSYIVQDMVQGATGYLEAHGKNVVVYNYFLNTDKKVDYLRFAEEHGFSGVLMLDTFETPEIIRAIEHMTRPVVYIHKPSNRLNIDAVCMDNIKGAYMLTEYLIRKGHTRIGLLAGTHTASTTREREQGYRTALEEAGLPVHTGDIFYGSFDLASGEAYLQEILRHTPDITAVLCCNELMAIGLLCALLDKGYRVPEDISVVSFHKSIEGNYTKVLLTSIDFDYKTLGMNAAEALLRRINTPAQPQKIVTFAPKLFEGDSVCPPRSR